ncbi:hypothetical protein PtB15_14B476 [Puccinia triticina]|nr:hypothetical protein PtB15_14B476 [Puccinia triticina]
MAGIQPQQGASTEEPPEAAEEAVDEVPDLNPPKKTKKGAGQKEASRKIATRSTSKVPEEPNQPLAAQPSERDGWEELLMDVGIQTGKGAYKPEEQSDITTNDQTSKKRGRPGSASNPVVADEEATRSRTQGAVPAWKIQETLVTMVERAMKAEADGDMALAGRLYDIGAGLGRAVPTKTQAVADRDERSTKQPYPAVPGLKVPVPVTKGNDSANCYKERQQSEVTKSSGTTTKGNRYNPRHGERDGGRDGGRDGNRRNF